MHDDQCHPLRHHDTPDPPRQAGTRRRQHTAEGSELRFAFYGRMSTVEFQNRTTSSGWQREVAE
ncbi:hypothetical protein ABZ342_16900 [Amycolatopsis sp. NPDC005961]|uniref:hypothetical protein n=1 Tax=Amycolatopsis sp. NPDC005961 TaxID=3156720 RepID=UPI0033D1EA47